jgi:hypothetical protein
MNNNITIAQQQIEDRLKEVRNTFESVVQKNKQKIFNFLSFCKVSNVYINYSGYGDSGAIDSVSFYSGSSPEKEKEIKSSKIDSWPKISGLLRYEGGFYGSIYNNDQGQQNIEDNITISEAIENFCYDILEFNHPGWEINSGSNGEIALDVRKKTIKLVHNEIIETTETHEHEY